ncbi:MAG TPA: redoxin family protein [Candidatus Angelobacter sp.]|nr:redoxin family protein [Candidatus Angelobacter sp.]
MEEATHRRVASRIELAANIGTIVVVVLAIGVWAMSSRKHAPEPSRISVGTKFELKNVNWQANKKSMVLAVSTNCHFCTESAGFYRELAEYCHNHGVTTIAVLPQSPAEALAYLKNEGVGVDDLRQSSLPSIQITGTPTLLLIDANGVVRDVWIGKLQTNQEKQVLSKVAL